MANYAIGLGVAALGGLALTSGSSTPAAAAAPAGTEEYFFRDYSWQVLLPSTSNNLIQPGPTDPAIIQALPPPPNLPAGGGTWSEYPRGYRSAIGFLRGGGTPPGQKGNPIFPCFPDIPVGLSVFEWIPNFHQITKINGYWVYHDAWQFENPKAIKAASGVLKFAPRYRWLNPVPPPPHQSAHSGQWVARHPGYFVWLTPGNTNTGVLTTAVLNDPQLAQYLTQPGTGGGTSASEPTNMPSNAVPYTPTSGSSTTPA